jgi:hypothetical protein
VPQQERRKRRHSRGRRSVFDRLARGIRRILLPPPTVKVGLPHAEHGKRGQIIAFAIALVLLLIAALAVIAVEGDFVPSTPVPAEE